MKKFFHEPKETIRGEKNTDLPMINSAYEYLEAFTETFQIPIMNSIHASVIKTHFLSNANLEIIKKRYDSIPIEEIENPLLYITKYFRGLIEAKHAEYGNSENKETAVSLRDFYEKFGFLTQKQINLIHFLYQKNTHYADKILKEEKRNILDKITEKITKKGIIKAYNKSMLSGDEETNFINSFLLARLTAESVQHEQNQISKKKEEIREVPKRMMSLFEMRKELIY